jgi:hypothetical protein
MSVGWCNNNNNNNNKWRFVNQLLLLSGQIIFRMLKKANAFGMILKH